MGKLCKATKHITGSSLEQCQAEVPNQKAVDTMGEKAMPDGKAYPRVNA